MHDLPASINLQPAISPIVLSDTIAAMDLRQLAALVAVDDHGSFSAAARALFTVQSNVSAHIAHLERELGVVLVDRARGRLTPEGRRGGGQGQAHPARARSPHRGRHLDGPRGVRRGPPRGHRHHRPLAGAPAPRRGPCRSPEGPGDHPRGQHHLADPPAGGRTARPGRRQPPRPGPRGGGLPAVRGGAGAAGHSGQPAGRPRRGHLRRGRRPAAWSSHRTAPRCAATSRPRLVEPGSSWTRWPRSTASG